MDSELENVVQQSNDYDKFSFLDANREVNRGHVEALKKAFEETGNLTRVQPILVNGHYQIIDGQHRFVACKELGYPIYYTMVPYLGVDEARSMNILHRNWMTGDYAKSYALSGNKHYQRYLELQEDYGFNHSLMIAYIENMSTGLIAGGNAGAFKRFRTGEFTITDEAAAIDRLNKLAEVREVTSLANFRPFAFALLYLLGNETFDFNRFVRKLKLANGSVVKRLADVSENLRMIEEIYNFHMAERNRVRLY